MNNSFSLQRTFKTGNLDSNLISRPHKKFLRAEIMQIKFEIQKLKQSDIEKESSCSISTLQRYINDIDMLSPYRI